METLKRIMLPILLLSQIAWMVDCQIQSVNWTNNLSDLLTKTGLPEDLPVGTKLGMLSISGYPAGVGHLTYSTNSSYFNVNETTGEVILNKELSYRYEPQFGVTFFARDDRQGFLIQTAVTVNVRGVNHAPYFDVPTYQVSVKDNVGIGTTFYNLIYFSDIDKDTERNGTVTLSCATITDQEACQTFGFSQSKAAGKDYSYLGSVSTNTLLDYNRKPKYTLLLVAKDDGDPPLSATATLTINIESQFQKQPVFLNTPITLNVDDRTSSAADLGSVQAKSGDSGAGTPAPLGFQITEDAKHWFYLENTTYNALLNMYSARIRTFGNISRAILLSDQYSFEITVAELSNGQPTKVAGVTIVQVKVNGTNTFSPTFSPNASVVNILEGLSVGAVIPGFAVRVDDPDQGDNGFFTIQVTRVTPSPVPDIFLVQPTSAQSSAAVYLTVNKPEYLSYDDPNKRQYQLVITARESKTSLQNSGTTSVTINVLSRYNNPPAFTRSEYLASLVDNRPAGTTVTDQIQANDPNGGDAGRITYAIVAGNQNTNFNISQSQATIVLAKPLTYAVTGQYVVLTIMAQDGTGLNATATLRIEIIDSTHRGPVFNPPFIYTNVLEGNVDLRPPIQFVASPLQRDRVVMYRIIGGNQGLFNLTTNPPSDASKQPTGTITINRGVDYNDTPNRSGVFQLIVEANSGGSDPLTTNLTVNVYVEDANNRPPVFNQTTYSSVITEVTPPETRLLTINATDLDAPNNDNSKIHYIIGGGSRDNFVVDYTTGVIRIASHPNLTIDRYGDQYNITVLAIDEGSPPNTATATVYIRVTDSVYRPPVFSPQTFTFYVTENTTRNTVIGATPAWSPDRRAVISYSIVPGSITAINRNSQPVTSSNMTFNYNTSFAISNTSIFVNGPLSYDYFVRTDFQVRAVVTNSENGTIPPAIANVTIFIVPPVQNLDTVTYLAPANGYVYISIYNTLPVGTKLAELTAIYAQKNTPVSRYSYTATPTWSADYINVNQTGLITLAQNLATKSLTLPVNFTYNVTASADPPSAASAFAIVVVNVRDINADNPVFNQARYDFTIYNNATQGNLVGKISATIPGSPQSPVTYEFQGSYSDAFYIDNSTGEIRVNNSAKANSLLVAVLTGQAYAGNSPRARVVVYINVIHFYNSNPPMFRLPSYVFYTLDKTPVNSVIGQVNAYNPDVYYNSTITYTVTPGNGTEYFQIDRVTGSIQTKKNLLFSPDPYILNVTATSSGVPMQSSFTVVRIYVANVSSGSEVGFHTPSDMQTVYAYVNCFNCPIDVNIKGYSTRLQPSLTFSLSTPGYDGPGNFTLNPTNDQTETILKTNGTLKLDIFKRWQTVCLTLTDNSPPSILAATRCINVTFVSSQPPGFDICPWFNGSALQANISEHTDPPAYVTTVIACSPEKPPEDTNMIYTITGGNDPIDCYGGKIPFTIDPVSGNITALVTLLWNCTRSITLNVTVSYRNGTKAVNGSTRQVVITIDPTDSSGPTFGSLLPGACRGVDTEVTDGILDFTPPGTVFIQMYAGDCDAPQFGKHNYTFDPNNGITFHVPGDSVSVQNVPNAFVIDINTGDIATNFPNYRQYSRGYFQMTVVATDDKKRSATAKLTVFIVREGQRIKFVFGKTPSDLKPVVQEFVDGTNSFLSQYNAYLKAYGVVLSTHIDKSAYYYFNETDMCFEVIRQGAKPEVLPAMEAIRLFPPDSKSNWNLTMTGLYEKYGVIGGPQVCYVKTTTHWWSGYWFLWWFLIALALFIFVIALILNILACCFWPMYTRGYLKSRPYIVLDEPPVTSPVSDFEWQESMHRIN